MVAMVVIVRRYQSKSRGRNKRSKEGRDAKKLITNPNSEFIKEGLSFKF